MMLLQESILIRVVKSSGSYVHPLAGLRAEVHKVMLPFKVAAIKLSFVANFCFVSAVSYML